MVFQLLSSSRSKLQLLHQNHQRYVVEIKNAYFRRDRLKQKNNLSAILT